MNSYPQPIPQHSTFSSMRVVIALFAVVAAFLLVTGAAFALGAFQDHGTDNSPQQHPLSGISNGSPGKP
jgi:hypothetical protein